MYFNFFAKKFVKLIIIVLKIDICTEISQTINIQKNLTVRFPKKNLFIFKYE